MDLRPEKERASDRYGGGIAALLPSAALEYPLPERLIATRPAEPRDSARLLVCRRSNESIEHRRVSDLPEYLGPGDILVVNDTAVAPARLAGARVDSGGRVEGLFLEGDDSGRWRVMLRANRRLRVGVQIALDDNLGRPSPYRLSLVEREMECWCVSVEPPAPVHVVLEMVGRTPLPPYILRARRGVRVADSLDQAWYQTVYADPAKRRSVAAPTAGLHFTPALLEEIARRGVRRMGVTLHVGAGTFKPVTAATLAQHRMHTEWFSVPAETLSALHDRAAGAGAGAGGGAGPGPGAVGRLFAVGTTSVRALESLPIVLPSRAAAWSARTELLIAPGYEFKLVSGLFTNFHLPRSTLLALVAAMVGLDRLLAIYREAVERGYRFYSYGDAMLVLP